VHDSQNLSYLDRASKIVNAVLDADAGNYEAMRLRSDDRRSRSGVRSITRG
jgi:hypothetical protein